MINHLHTVAIHLQRHRYALLIEERIYFFLPLLLWPESSFLFLFSTSVTFCSLLSFHPFAVSIWKGKNENVFLLLSLQNWWYSIYLFIFMNIHTHLFTSVNFLNATSNIYLQYFIIFCFVFYLFISHFFSISLLAPINYDVAISEVHCTYTYCRCTYCPL